MKFAGMLLGLFVVAAEAGEIFVNGNFKCDARGQAMLWNTGSAAPREARQDVRTGVKSSPDGKNILLLESNSEKEAAVHSLRPVRVRKGDTITLTFQARGKGTLRAGLYCYSGGSKTPYTGPVSVPRAELTPEWQERKAELTVSDLQGAPTEEVRVFFAVCPGGSAEIRALEVRGDMPDEADAVTNGSFEAGTAAYNGLFPWRWDGRFTDITLCTEDVPDGKRCLKITSDPAKKSEPMHGWEHFAGCCQELAVKPGTTYTVSALMKSELQHGAAGFGVRFLDKFSEGLPDHPRPLKFFPLTPKLADRGWIPVSYSFKTPAECVRICLFVAGDGFGGSFSVDKVKLEEGLAVPQIPQCGEPDEAAWENALRFEDFIQVGSQEKNSRDALAEVLPAVPGTRLFLLAGNGNLYMRIIGDEPNMADRELKAEGHDGSPYNDDSVEIFIDPNRDGQNFYQIAVNSAGAVYDAFGTDKKWDPASLKVSVSQEAGRWILDLRISFLDLGYGEQEYRMPDKKIALAVFRNRKLRGQTMERSSFLQWAWPVYQDAKRYCPMDAGTAGIRGERVSYLYYGVDSPSTTRPRQAWKTDSPLYEELMGERKMHPDPRLPAGDCEIGRFTSGNYWWNSSGFALRSGMKYHFSEVFDLTKEMRASVEMVNAFSPGSFTFRMLEKYPFAVNWYAIPQFAAGRSDEFPNVMPNPKNPYKRFVFLADDRVAKLFCDNLERDFKRFHKHIAVVPLGHETHHSYFLHYDKFRAEYLKREPEVWAGFEREAKEKFGFGKIGLPESAASATPFERIVYHRWLLDKYNRCMKEAASRLRKIKPEVVLLSEVEVGNFAAMLYENAVGTYDYIVQQQVPSGSPSRQNIGFGVKIMGDLAETPVRGGPHVEHYFFSLNPEETNEIISEVFRAGGRSLSLWLIDWFGKTYTDYYGSPDRFAEIRHIFREIGRMRELRFPEPDTAVFFSNATRFAENWWFVNSPDPNAREYESAFTVLGPRAGSWFRFISDVQITNGRHPLDAFKIIYVPSARYQDEAALTRLTEYAANGGTLVLASPDTFGLSDDGSGRPGLKKELMGLAVSGQDAQPSGFRFGELNIAASGNPVWRMTPLGNARVLAVFEDGRTAVIENPYGRGRVITFASNPFSFSLLTDRNAWQMFRSLQKQAGCQLDQPIWRFRFPLSGEKPALWPENQKCVTGNACAWIMESIVDGPNETIPFTASYSLAPDLIPDKLKNCGALFNRRKALDAPIPSSRRASLETYITGWAAGWKNRSAFSIRIDFASEIEDGTVKLWCHGDIPEITLYSISGGSRVREGSVQLPAGAEEVDVREFAIPFRGRAKSFELTFGPRANGDFYLGEMEFWRRKE